MATHEKRGWVWTPEEREWVKTWQRKLQNRYDKMLGQLRLYERQLPQFADDAKEAARPFLEACKPLLALDPRKAGRKYQDISPEGAKEGLERVNAAVEQWNQFARRHDVAGAANELSATHRARQRQAEQELARHLASPEFSRQIDEWVRQVTRHANMWVDGMHSGYDQEELAVLRRLVLVHFIRFTCDGSERRGREAADFANAEPSPSTADLLHKALEELVRDQAAEHVKKGSFSPSYVVQALLAGACTGLDRSVKEWKEKGIGPRDLPRDYFTVRGVDYSVAANPD
jgi:hypothetical protein